MDGIKPHCMGTAFPDRSACPCCGKHHAPDLRRCWLPTAADLDAVAEEQRVKEETGKTK